MKLSVAGKPAGVSATLFWSVFTHAALTPIDIDGNATNGHEGVYDDVLDITWLADANLAATNTFDVAGINANGNMQWDAAEAFILAMNADNTGVGYLGVNTWRHSTVAPVDGSSVFNTSLSDNGASDFSYNLSAPVSLAYNPAGASPDFIGSELAYHYYNNFSAIGACNGTGATIVTNCPLTQPENIYGIDDAPDPDNNKALFTNLLNTGYWSGTELNSSDMWLFSNFYGQQFFFAKDIEFHVWAVAPGNVAASAVPVPPAVWLYGSGIFGLIALIWRR